MYIYIYIYIELYVTATTQKYACNMPRIENCNDSDSSLCIYIYGRVALMSLYVRLCCVLCGCTSFTILEAIGFRYICLRIDQ